jgi:hypothetical protein
MNHRARWMHLTSLATLTSVLQTGCGGTKVVFVHPADHDLVRLGPDVRGHVYFWNGSQWELSKNEVRIPEGWYAGYVAPEGDDTTSPTQTAGSSEPTAPAAAGVSRIRPE